MSAEDFGFLLSLLVNGASIGLMYALIALGFVLVYKATDAINFAQGEFVMLGAVTAYLGATIAGSTLLGIVLAPLVGIAWGAAGVPLPAWLATFGDLLGAAAGSLLLTACGTAGKGRPKLRVSITGKGDGDTRLLFKAAGIQPE